jgi:hypothetical protein
MGRGGAIAAMIVVADAGPILHFYWTDPMTKPPAAPALNSRSP